MDEVDLGTLPLPQEEMQNVDATVFKHADVLTNAEVAILLETIIAQKSEAPDAAGNNKHSIEKMKQVKEYVDRFVGTTNTDVATHVRNVLSEHHLRGYEIGLVANLNPQTVDEAQALVPSLKDDARFSPDELDAMLRDLQQMQAFA